MFGQKIESGKMGGLKGDISGMFKTHFKGKEFTLKIIGHKMSFPRKGLSTEKLFLIKLV